MCFGALDEDPIDLISVLQAVLAQGGRVESNLMSILIFRSHM